MYTAKTLGVSEDVFARAKKIKLLLMDVDGVLTDNNIIWLPPAEPQAEPPVSRMRKLMMLLFYPLVKAPSAKPAKPINAETLKAKVFNTHDGGGLHICRSAGIKTGIISGSPSTATRVWATHQHIDFIDLGNWNKKFESAMSIMEKEGLTPEEVAFVGDDFIDAKVMQAVGLAIAVRNARPEIEDIAHYTTATPGGYGAIREVAELLAKAQGFWPQVCAQYNLPEKKPKENKGGLGFGEQLLSKPPTPL